MIYLDNAATSYPKPEAVYDRLGSFLKEHGANAGRSGYRLAIETEKIIRETRDFLAHFFGSPSPERLIFTLNATDALNMGIKGVLEKGDHVITSDLEHNSVARPLNRLEQDGIISITRINASQEGIIDPEDVRKNLKPNTKLVILTYASNVLGAIQPVERIGKILAETKTLFMVDAAQTAGILPINIQEMNIDLLAFTGHKALFGPPGIGGLVVGKKANPRPWREGGTGGDSSSILHPEEFPSRLEGGSLNTVGIAALAEGVKFIQSEGIDKIRLHKQNLTQELIDGLKDNDDIILYSPCDASLQVGLLSCNIKGILPQEVAVILDESFNIAVRSGLHCAPTTHKAIGTFPDGALRLSPGFFNSSSDIHQAIEGLRKIAASTRKLV